VRLVGYLKRKIVMQLRPVYDLSRTVEEPEGYSRLQYSKMRTFKT